MSNIDRQASCDGTMAVTSQLVKKYRKPKSVTIARLDASDPVTRAVVLDFFARLLLGIARARLVVQLQPSVQHFSLKNSDRVDLENTPHPTLYQHQATSYGCDASPCPLYQSRGWNCSW